MNAPLGLQCGVSPVCAGRWVRGREMVVQGGIQFCQENEANRAEVLATIRRRKFNGREVYPAHGAFEL